MISAPAGVLLARIMVPRDAAVERASESDLGAEAMYESSIDALIKGIGVGLEICLKIAATLIVFVSIVAMVDGALGQLAPVGGAPISLERIFGKDLPQHPTLVDEMRSAFDRLSREGVVKTLAGCVHNSL